jgi:hypothetical protein
MNTRQSVAASLPAAPKLCERGCEARRWRAWKATATRLTETRLQLVGGDQSLLAVARARRRLRA